MKKLVFAVAIFATVLVQNSFAQTEKKDMFSNIISGYLDLKNALIKENGDSARAAAKKLFNAIADVPMEKLSADHHKVWMQFYEKLSYDAEHIKGTDELEHQRAHFTKLSVNMFKMLKAINVNTTDLYYQFCPMANEGKGAYWISEKEQVSNPYMGKKMPSCGSTKETLKSSK